MEVKKFISTLKGFRTRFTNKPNANLEKECVTRLSEKFGGRLEVVASLNEAGELELKEYFKKVCGVISVVPVENENENAPEVPAFDVPQETVETAIEEKPAKESLPKKTQKVYHDLKDLADIDIDLTERVMPMTTYQRYLKDKFPGENAPIKKGKLHFRGYRISCDIERGFLVEDTLKYYATVETPFEGIPTPKELGEWLEKPGDKKLTSDEYQKAVERGKELARKAEEEKERVALEKETKEEEPDYESLRRKTLSLISDARSKTIDVDPEKIINMIPFKRWRRKAKSLFTQWKDRKIRYPKFLNELETLTNEETFVIEEKRHRSTFTGTLLPVHKKVGLLVGDKLEVDGKWIDAVPFLLDYLLFYEKRAMSQIMKYAAGEISETELIRNPLEVDWKVEYNKRALKNTAHNARVLGMVYQQVGIITPQDALYEADLEVGDRILILDDGELRTKTVSSVEREIILGKGVGLTKLDNWIKLPKKETVTDKK